MRNIILTLILSIYLATPFANAKDNIVGDLSQDNVSINATFEGSRILIFGAIKRDNSMKIEPSDIIIEVIGPNQEATLRKKKKILGIWVNNEAIELKSVPSFYTIFFTKPIETILENNEKNRVKVGINESIKLVEELNNELEIINTITRIKNNDGSYLLQKVPLNFDQGTLFSAKVDLPANLTEGDYKTRIHLVQRKKIVDSSESIIQVRKIGLEKWLYTTAHNSPFFYGIFSILIALFSGWAASEIFRVFRR